MTVYSKSIISLLALGTVLVGSVMPYKVFAQSMLPSFFEGDEQPAIQQPKLEDIPVDELLHQENMTKSESISLIDIPVPRTLRDLQEIGGYKGGEGNDADKSAMPIDIRKEALKEAALSFGARGALAARSYEINKQVDDRASYMDRVYDFQQLLIAAPSGFMIEPPIISESLKALLIEGDGQKAAVSDAIYRINENVKIVSAPKSWRNYLQRTWGVVEDPPEILRPKDEKERTEWRINVKNGWDEGLEQANEVFEQDLNRLQMEFGGMVRYRQLLAQGMVSAPFAQQIDRGVTGEPSKKTNTLRIGDRAVVITGIPELITESNRWQPANR